jgi:hypothetical protein
MILAVNKATEPVRKAQDFFAGTGNFEKVQAMPFAVQIAVMANGARNGAASIGLFNVETPEKHLLPSFNLKRRTLADLLDPGQLTTKYYYVENSSGRKVNVLKPGVKTNSAGRIYQDKTGKFLIKEQGLAGDSMPEDIKAVLGDIGESINKFPGAKKLADMAPFDIVETGPHTVLVFSAKKDVKQKLGTGFFKDKKGDEIGPYVLFSSALVRVDGGSMYFWEMDGASYSPHLDRVIMPDLTSLGSAGSKELLKALKDNAPSGNNGVLSRVFEYSDKVNKIISDGVLVH